MVSSSEQAVRSPEQWSEWTKCRLDAVYWMQTHLKVLDKLRGWIPLELYPSQLAILDDISAGRWPLILKTRRMGGTTISLAAFLHQHTFVDEIQSCICAQKETTAKRLLREFGRLDGTQPGWMRRQRIRSSTTEIEFVGGGLISATASGEKAARSEGLDLLLIDEAAFVEGLGQTLDAAEPTLETSGGIAVVMSTADRPGDEFHAMCLSAREGKSKFSLRFVDWTGRPDRTQEWYDSEAKHHESIHGYMARNYPRTFDEAFEAGGKRVYPAFGRKTHIVECIEPADESHPRYRSIDFGNSEQHPFVCVWAWHDANSNPRLTLDPDCEILDCSPDLIGRYADGMDQMFAYRRHPRNDTPIKFDDDVPDALRYMVTFWSMTGHVHVYRLLFIRNGQGYTVSPLAMLRRVVELSGHELIDPVHNVWRESEKAERYDGTVCDSHSGPGYINMVAEEKSFGRLDLDLIPYALPSTIKGVRRGEIEVGLAWVTSLLMGNAPWGMSEDMTEEQRDYRRFERGEEPRDWNEQARFNLWRHRKVPRKKRLIWGYQ